MKKVSFLLLMSLLFPFVACNLFNNQQPIPKDKEPFIGVWTSRSGFTFEIQSAGTAKLTQLINTQDPDFNKLNIQVAPAIIEKMFVQFEGDSVLFMRKPLYYAKKYHIDRSPYQDGDTSRMIINGVVFTKQ